MSKNTGFTASEACHQTNPYLVTRHGRHIQCPKCGSRGAYQLADGRCQQRIVRAAEHHHVRPVAAARAEHRLDLGQHGVTVYLNSCLLHNVNDSAAAMRALSSKCRRFGFEFHHLYVAGAQTQRHWNSGRPVDLDTIIGIATEQIA